MLTLNQAGISPPLLRSAVGRVAEIRSLEGVGAARGRKSIISTRSTTREGGHPVVRAPAGRRARTGRIRKRRRVKVKEKEMRMRMSC